MDIFKKIKFNLYIIKKSLFKNKYIFKQNYIILSDFSNIPQVKIEQGVNVENIYPEIPNIGLKSFRIRYSLMDRCILIFKGVIVKPSSSFIYFDRYVYIPKQKHKTNKIKAKISENRIFMNERILIESKPEFVKRIYSKFAISLMGHYSYHFGHFLLEYLERMEHFEKININIENLDVLINEPIDPNILELILEKKNNFGFNVIKVPTDTIVECENYYHIEPQTIVCDGANYSSITDKLYYPSVKEFYSKFQSKKIHGLGKKIFITRRGKRTMLNLEQIEHYFRENGYVVMDNFHLLSINEKKEIFSNASYVVGPGGSAFFNCIWCPKDVKILIFINYEIAYDNCLQNMLSEDSQIYHLAGKEVNYEFYNSDYMIEMEEIIKYSKELGFTS